MKKSSIFLIMLIATRLSTAQTAVTNTGILYVNGGSDILYLGSDFTNNSGAALTNNGQFYVKGNITNDQVSMAVGSGTLRLTGSSLQSLNGTQAFKTFNLVTDNTAGFTLNNNLSVSGAHTFTNGMISTSATPNYLVYEAGSSYSGDGDSRHVNGWVKKNGNTNFTFPVGNGSIERTAGVVNLSAVSEINAKYMQPTQNIWNLQGPLVRVKDNEYWQIDKISGGTAQIALNWDHSKVPVPIVLLSEIRVAHYNGSLWINAGGTASGDIAATGTITSGTVSTFSPFTFGFESVPLPLNFLSFTAERKNNITQLKWTTADEQNVDHFTIERSNDGIRFYDIGDRLARNSGNREDYLYDDHGAIYDIAYYRIKSVDADGEEKRSRIVTVVADSRARLSLLANPVRDRISLIASPALNGIFNYSITSMNGQLMQQGDLAIRNGGSYQVQLSWKLKAGAYTLEISNGSESFRYKLIVQ